MRLNFKRLGLTRAGRARIEQLANGDDLWLPADGSESAQCAGEAHWMLHWETVLLRLGLGELACLTEATEPPPFWALQVHARLGAYRTLERFWELAPIDVDRPGTIGLGEPGHERVVEAPSWARWCPS